LQGKESLVAKQSFATHRKAKLYNAGEKQFCFAKQVFALLAFLKN
jgi:hypothetical protein